MGVFYCSISLFQLLDLYCPIKSALSLVCGYLALLCFATVSIEATCFCSLEVAMMPYWCSLSSFCTLLHAFLSRIPLLMSTLASISRCFRLRWVLYRFLEITRGAPVCEKSLDFLLLPKTWELILPGWLVFIAMRYASACRCIVESVSNYSISFPLFVFDFFYWVKDGCYRVTGFFSVNWEDFSPDSLWPLSTLERRF